jgi:predicted transcriptional regulator
MNLATVTMHINILEDAGLILCEHVPGERGTQRVCGCFFNWLNMHMTPKPPNDIGQVLEVSIPIGAYSHFEITPTCGLFSEEKHIGNYDDPISFYEAERINAQLLWFHSGFVEYLVPHRLPEGAELESLNLSMEICSEAPTYHEDWLSDITVWINEIELGSWTSPADFGGVRGKLSPAWQPTHATQFGLLKTWQVTQKNTQVDGEKVSDIRLNELRIFEKPLLSLRIGVKQDATHVGGINIFGSKFGNHPQDILLRLHYHQPNDASTQVI